MGRNLVIFPLRISLISVLICWFAVSAAAGSKYGVVYRFQGGDQGYTPYELIADKAGNFYGSTQYGGIYSDGVVFELSPHNGKLKETVLASFSGGMFGADMNSLVLDASGNLYGAAGFGGNDGIGMIFELSPPSEPGKGWKETILYSFSFWDGYQPEGLTMDINGNLYGATVGGGHGCSGFGCGTIYELIRPKNGDKTWKHKFLYQFNGVPGGNGNGDGSSPFYVIFDKHGNLIGTTSSGGSCQLGSCFGTVFKLQPPNLKRKSWKETILFRFGNDVQQLVSGVVFDSSGAMYGAALDELFQLRLVNGHWSQTTLASGGYIYGQPVLDSSGNVYSTTLNGGSGNNGLVFKFTPPNFKQSTLHEFASGQDGQAPDGEVILGADGAVYGTTLRGGNNKCAFDGGVGCGTVFRVQP